MLSQKLIDINIEPISASDTGSKALSLMEGLNISEIPVVREGNYIGIISEDDIWMMENQQDSIKPIINKLKRVFVTLDNDVFEIVKIVNEHNLTMIPVIHNKKYIGGITLKGIIKALASIVAMQSDGGVIILEIQKNDYSMSEIAQIVEGNNAKILSSYISDHQEKNLIKLTLKLNVSELNPILQPLLTCITKDNLSTTIAEHLSCPLRL